MDPKNWYKGLKRERRVQYFEERNVITFNT